MKDKNELIAKILTRYSVDVIAGRFTFIDRPVAEFEGKKRPAEVLYKMWRTRFLGKEAFTRRNASGHCCSVIDGTAVYAHQVIWAVAHGEWPKSPVNHIDGNPSNNRLDNLREATQAQVSRNMKTHKDNTSGKMGVNLRKDTMKWQARIGGKYLGCFESFEDAVTARQVAESNMGYHANHDKR